MFLNFQTDRSEQTVQTKIRLLLQEQSDQGLQCLPFHLTFLDEGSSLIRVYNVYHSVWPFWTRGAVWSGSTMFTIPSDLFGRGEQSDQGLQCLPFRLHVLDEGSSLIRVYNVYRSVWPFWTRGAVWSGSTMFTILSDLFGRGEQSDQGLQCLPFRLHFSDEGSSLIRVYNVYHSVWPFWTRGAVWSGSTMFTIPSARFGRGEQSDQGLQCLLFRLTFLDEGSSLIRVYNVYHSVWPFWMRGAVWSESTMFTIPSDLFGRGEQSDQGLQCLPFRLHVLDKGSSLIRVYNVYHSVWPFWTRGAVWSGSTMFTIPSARFGRGEQSDQGLQCLPFRLTFLDEGSSLIRVYNVYHSVCTFWTRGAVWSGSTMFTIPSARFGRGEQSDQGLQCLPFRLHVLDEGSSLIRVYNVYHSVCTFWTRGAVWSESTMFTVPSDLFGRGEQSDQSLQCLPFRLTF